MTEKRKGRPPQYETPEEMEIVIEEYFKECDKKEKPYTITGLANSIGLTRQGLLNYQAKEDFVDTVKRAKSKVEQYAEEHLFIGRNVTGAIFNLKNNHPNWIDHQVIENKNSFEDLSNEELEEKIKALTDKIKG